MPKSNKKKPSLLCLANVPNEIDSVDIELIDAAPYNPEHRTSQRIQNIQENVGENGQLVPVTLVACHNGRYVLADGHRRLQVVKNLGYTTITATVWRPPAAKVREVRDALFASLNKDTKRWGEGESLGAAINGGPIINGTVANAFELLCRFYGKTEKADSWLGYIPNIPEYLRTYSKGRGVGPSTLTKALTVAKYSFYAAEAAGDATTLDGWTKKILTWFAKTGSQAGASIYVRVHSGHAMTTSNQVKKLLSFVRTNTQMVSKHAGDIGIDG
jgi:hypothetical protein